jgi:hypothetical protein
MQTIYTAYVCPDGETVNVSDDKTSFDDVLDNAVSTAWDDVEFRMFRLDFDVETGAFESASEVTDLAHEVILKRLAQRDLPVPAYIAARAIAAE